MDFEEVITPIKEHDFLAYNRMRMISLLSATMLITECKKWKFPEEEDCANKVYAKKRRDFRTEPTYPNEDSVLGYLNSKCSVPISRLIITLGTHADIVHTFVKHSVLFFNDDLYWVEKKEAILLTEALSVFQEWKQNAIIKRKVSYLSYKEGTGRGDYDALRIWNDYNKRLLFLIEDREERIGKC